MQDLKLQQNKALTPERLAEAIRANDAIRDVTAKVGGGDGVFMCFNDDDVPVLRKVTAVGVLFFFFFLWEVP